MAASSMPFRRSCNPGSSRGKWPQLRSNRLVVGPGNVCRVLSLRATGVHSSSSGCIKCTGTRFVRASECGCCIKLARNPRGTHAPPPRASFAQSRPRPGSRPIFLRLAIQETLMGILTSGPRTSLSSGTKARASEPNRVIAERASASVGSRRHVATTAETMCDRAAASTVSNPPMLAPRRMTGRPSSSIARVCCRFA